MENIGNRAKQFIETQLPDATIRKAVLSSLANAIKIVNSYSPSCWGLSKGLCLQFTWKQIRTPYIWWVHDWQKGEVMYHLDCEDVKALSPLDRQLLIDEARLDERDPNWVKAFLCLPRQDHVHDLVIRLFESYVKKHVGLRPNKTLGRKYQNTHNRMGAGFIQYMQNYLGDREIPQPGWFDPSSSTALYSGNQSTRNAHDPFSTFQLIDSYLKSEGYSFTPTQIASFYTALQTKGFVILSGISGTGKTKLAQKFANLLPQPSVVTVISDDIIRIRVKPYMHKYKRMIIPKAWVKLFIPPEPGKSVPVELEFEGQKGTYLLSHYHGNGADYIQLLLKEKAATWFLINFPINSEIGLEMKSDSDGNLTGFKLAPPDQFAQTYAVDVDTPPQNHIFLSVRPDWRDSKSLLGYFNPLKETYERTPFLDFILQAKRDYEGSNPRAWFVILDEMNLARVEYYFADLLSVLESGRDDDGFTTEALLDNSNLGEDEGELKDLRLPPNLYFVGTVNMDETTQSFSPKVLDRAFSIEFIDVNFEEYHPEQSASPIVVEESQRQALLEEFIRSGEFAVIDKQVIGTFSELSVYRQKLDSLNKSLQPFNHHFGYRVFDEVMMFLLNAQGNQMFEALIQEFPGKTSMELAFDQAVLMKVLPKFHGSRGKIEQPLLAVLRWCAGDKAIDEEPVKKALEKPGEKIDDVTWLYPATATRVLRMIQSLNSTGFASFG